MSELGQRFSRFCAMLCAVGLMLTAAPAFSGAACVMAKWQGMTLDYALVAGPYPLVDAQEAATAALHAKGYGRYGAGVDVTHPQAISNLSAGYAVVLRSTFRTWRDKERTSFGCGFSAQSFDDALWQAIRDMQRFSWGWKPDRDGYEMIERRRF